MLSSIFITSFLFGASFAAQSSPTVVCVAGQCLEGYTNTTIGAVLSGSGAATDILLLPGQYTSTSDPSLLHNLLTSSSTTISSSPGFDANLSLPLNLELQPGVAVFPQANYSGDASFVQLPSTPLNSTSLSVGSLALSSNVWAAISTGSSKDRVIFWDSVPDVSQLPSGASGLSALLDIQSSACSPPCSGAGVCSASGQCICPTGFNGTSCETCSPGFFGPSCQACPADCAKCDDGMTGTGRCIEPIIQNLPSTCNCVNGVCGSNGQCTCNPGWTAASNGTACAKCADGFFLDNNENCEVCSLGCTQCADGSGDCITCKSGFTQNANDRTQCFASQSTTSTGTTCPDGSFSNGTACEPCSPLCQTCTGPDSSDCIICGAGKYTLNGNCVGTDGNGVCDGSTLVADNNKHECTTCPLGCTSCKFSSFNVASTIDQVQCTGCLPGTVLSGGKCVASCPTGTFLDPKDNVTCTACDSSCGTCAGSATFCLTCANNQLASNGTCVASCPSNSFSSSGQCITCHSDCASCSGSSFNQCSSCPSDRPVLTNGRCLPTCSQSQFFDKTSSTCQSCDASCSSCSGSGPSNCLACSSSSQVLRGGSCVSANCNGTPSTISGLGVCLSDLVVVPTVSGTAAPLPSITGINTPTSTNTTTTTRRPLAWWEILLMALGCAFIFVVILMCWRRRARKRRAAATANFAAVKGLNRPGSWRYRLARFGERLFGHKKGRRWMLPQDPDEIRLQKLRAAEEARVDGHVEKMRLAEDKHHEREVAKLRASEIRHDKEMDKLLDAYEYSRAGSSRSPSPLPSLHSYSDDRHSHKASSRGSGADRKLPVNNELAQESLYSQVTGQPRRAPEPRLPIRNVPAPDVPHSRFSGSTTYSSWLVPDPPLQHSAPTPAQEYARTVSQQGFRDEAQDAPQRGAYWMQPHHTGSSGGSRNPFLR
ncbi:insulin-like growth factor binding protein [Dichomitus squalens]|uniref:Insulin-like growth factor binding protein n=1 Tax=Dichomitus squalens TaxID=114155 RepID=A0A4V2K3P7_9APHY|nr:insulin-like growth factor binding protein [Dichomitus squalens]TBU57037.1 insulin-like growth factor binding protein [Dichomitus squalens]